MPRQLYAKFLDDLSSMMARTPEGLRSLVTHHAEELGLESLGEVEEWSPDSDVFTSSLGGNVDWDVAAAKFARIGKPMGLFITPSHRRFGVRGEKGDATFRIFDIQQRRLQSLQHYFDKTDVP